MLFKFSVSAVCAVLLLSGCATTQKLMSSVGSSDTPLEQVLKAEPELKQATHSIEIRQVFNRVEAPTAAQVTVVQAGLLDDSVRASRSVYSFKQVNGDWKLSDTQKSYQCYRGKNTRTFQTVKCP